MKYYVADKGKARGPYSPEELRSLGITPSTMVWNNTLKEWTAVRSVPELATIARDRVPAKKPTREMPRFSKGKAVCALFGLLPMGILAFVFHGGAENAYRAGNYAAAYRKARLAHTFTKIGFTIFWISLIILAFFVALVTLIVLAASS